MGNKQGQQLPEGIRIKGNSLQLYFNWQGKRYFETVSNTCTATDIKRWSGVRHKVVSEIKAGWFSWDRYAVYFPASKKVTGMINARNPLVAEVAQAYVNSFNKSAAVRTRYVNILNRLWLPAFGHKRITEVRYSDITNVIAERAYNSYKTYNNDLIPLRGVFRHAERDKLITSLENPVRDVEWIKPQQRDSADPLHVDERDAVLEYFRKYEDERFYHYFRVAFYTGARNPSEVAAFWWPDIDFRRSELRIHQVLSNKQLVSRTKTGDERIIVLAPEALDSFKCMKKFTFLQNEWVFMSPRYNAPFRQPQKSLMPAWKRALKKVGLRDRGMRQTRHTAATLWIMNGYSPGFVADQLGDNLSTVFRNYARWLKGAEFASERERMMSISAENVPIVK